MTRHCQRQPDHFAPTILHALAKNSLVSRQARRRAQPASSASTPCFTPCRARMQGQYPGNRGGRPPGVCRSADGEAPSARLFLCAGCRAQVLICRCCDRGQLYCAGACAPRARRRAQQDAGRRYQSSRRGRLAHAARARRYRGRSKNVTHHGSPPPQSDDLLPLGPPEIAGDAAAPDERPRRPTAHCHWCGRRCQALVRQGFLRRRGPRRGRGRHERMGPEHGDAS